MKLTVKNFGPIKTAKVTVKPMTVFVGPSNTGKSYLAILIYAIAKGLNASSARPAGFTPFSRDDARSKNTVAEIISNKRKFTNLANKLFLASLKNIRVCWEKEAIRCFGEEWKNVIKQNGDSASIVISDDDNRTTLDLLSPEKDKSLSLDPMFVDSLYEDLRQRIFPSGTTDQYLESIDVRDLTSWMMFKISPSLDFLSNVPRSTESRSVRSARENRFHSARDNLFGDILRSARSNMLERINDTHYLPAVRGGLMQSHRILVSALVDRAPSMGLTGAEIVPFTGVLADFLKKLLMIDNRPKRPGFLFEKQGGISGQSKEIERRIMHGAINVKTLATRYPDFRYKFVDKNSGLRDISLMYASSSVSELAPIVLFIRYYLSAKDIFIVEEPEAHLHPEAQRVIAGILVELVNAGVRVIVTTHSDVILEQISNFIHADKISDAKVLNEKAEGRTLSKEKAGVYLFKKPVKHGQGTTVEAIKVDDQMGIVTQDHLDVSSDLYNETVDLFNARKGNAEENA